MKKAVLLDVSAIMYRSYYAHMNLRTSSEPTGATFGFLNTLLGVLKEFEPEYIIGAFDVSRKSLERTKIYDKYKSDRKPMPDELALQIKRIEELLDVFNIKKVKIEGHEADDVMGTYAKELSREGIETYVVTGDKDLSQVLDENIKIALLGKGDGKSRFGILRTPEDVVAQLGVTPELIPDLFGLIGDSSDGIPGVRKVGPKKAVPMLDLYGNLEGIYENVEKLSDIPGIGKGLVKNIIEDKDLAFLSRELAVIKTDIDLNFNLQDMKYNKDLNKLVNLCKELNFKSYIKRFTLELEKEEKGKPTLDIKKVESSEKKILEEADSQRQSELEKALEEILKVIDTASITMEEFELIEKKIEETLSEKKEKEESKEVEILKEKEFERSNIVDLDGIKKLKKEVEKSDQVALFANEEGIVFVTDKGSRYVSLNPSALITAEITLDALKPLFELDTPYIIYGYKKLLKSGIDPKNIKCDIFIGNYLLTNHTKEEFENLVLDRDGEVLKTQNEILKEKSIEKISLEDMHEFLEIRAKFLYRSGTKFLEELEEENLTKIYNIEMELVKVLYKMEEEGILINLDYFKEYQQELAVKLDEIIPQIKAEVKKGVEHNINMMELSEEQIRESLLQLGKLNYKKKSEYTAYEEKIEKADLEELLNNQLVFNIASPKQLGIVLFQLMKLAKVKKESVGVEVLEVLRDRDGEVIAKNILEYRKLAKLQSTYVEALPKLVDKHSRIHTTFNQTGTATGRLSSSNPNLQNIPVKTPEGIKIRQGFEAKDGYKLLAIDYSQIELRVLAEISQDETLILAYEQDKDLHDLTARKLFSLTEDEEVSREKRSLAKIVNFSIIYGKTAFGLSSELKISLSEAKEYISRYFTQYPGVKALETKIIEDAKCDGFVRTLYDRKRAIDGINSSNKNIVKQAERMAVNSVIQGTAADILKIVMVELDKKLEGREDIKMNLQVHDELIFEVKEDKIEEYAKLIKDIMETTVKLDHVKLKANVAMGYNWSEAK
ncbi:DNA polymerase [Psychrilyobacter atlanticus]|uniref:DNA polymerase n=1 Tax=Psychrilyobacter atlanticus TaxID=271091 RepID=UPI00041A1B4E|nr:DNA polymerase [Psychrilyobacter atlanticus]